MTKSTLPNITNPTGEIGEGEDVLVLNTERASFEFTREIVVSETSFFPSIDELEELKGLDALVPGSATRIIDDALLNSAHIREKEKRNSVAEIRNKFIGQIFAFLFAVAGLVTTAFCAAKGQSWVAGILGSTTIAAVVGAFLFERKNASPRNTSPRSDKSPHKNNTITIPHTKK